MKLPTRPTSDAPINLQWAWDVCDALRALQVSAGQGLRIQAGPAGILLSASVRPTARTAAHSTPAPWDVTFDGDSATFANCVWLLGGTLYAVTLDAYAVTGDDGDIWLAAWINTGDGTAEIHEGDALDEVTDDEEAEPRAVVKVPLYKIVKATAEDVVSLRVELRYVHGVPVIPLRGDADAAADEDTAQQSLETAEGALQLFEFDADTITEKGFTEVVEADPDTGALTSTGMDNFYLVLQQIIGGKRQVVYMPMGEGTREKESSDDPCEDHPGGGDYVYGDDGEMGGSANPGPDGDGWVLADEDDGGVDGCADPDQCEC